MNPSARVSYLAYQATLACPEATKADSRVFCEFAPIRRCYRHALDDPGCAVNRSQLTQLHALKTFFADAPLHITVYWLDASRSSLWKRPAVKLPVEKAVMAWDIQLYRELWAQSIASYAVMCDNTYWQQFGAPPISDYGHYLNA